MYIYIYMLTGISIMLCVYANMYIYILKKLIIHIYIPYIPSNIANERYPPTPAVARG